MVIGNNMQAMQGARWSFYLAFAACLLFGISTQLSFQKPEQVQSLLQPIKISMVTLAAPKQVVEMPPLPPVEQVKLEPVIQQSVLQDIVVFKEASQAILLKKEEQPETPKVEELVKVEPMPLPPVKPQEPMEIAELPKPEPIQQVLPKVEPKPVPKIVEKVEPVKMPVEAVEKPIQQAMTESMVDDGQGDAEATVIEDARFRRQTPPSYPRRALDLGQQGVVMIHALVMTDGHPKELKVFETSGHRLLDKSAMAAVRKWEFEPRSINGVPTEGWVRVPVRFVIQ